MRIDWLTRAVVLALIIFPKQTNATAEFPSWLNGDNIVLPLDRAALVNFPEREVSTTTPWSSGVVVTYRGVSLDELLQTHALNAAPIIEARGSNGFSSRIPRAEIKEFNPILATHRECQPIDTQPVCQKGVFRQLETEDFGPILLVWPDQNMPDAIGARDNSRWVWFLSELRGVSHSTARLIDD